MSYYNRQLQQPQAYPGQQPLAPFGIAPPLAPTTASGYLQGSSAYPYAQHSSQQFASAYPQYPNLATSAYAQQVQPYYAQQPYGLYPAQQYPSPNPYPPTQSAYTGPHLTHPVTPGVQTDAYGLPFVPGDITLQFAQTFRVEEKALSATRDSFVVRDMNGALRYKVDGSFTANEVKTMKDIHGQTLLVLRESRLRIRDRVTIFSPTNVPLMTLQKTSPVQIGTKKVHGFVGAYPKGNPDIVITGNHSNTHFRIMNTQNQEVGIVKRRRFTVKNMLTDQDTYEVTVQGGSPALICLIAVGLDEIYED